MKFLLDENADYRLFAYLAGLGHDVTAVAHDYPGSLSDGEVLNLAHDEKRILITNDRDFGELVFRRQLPHAGVVLFRLRSVELASKMAGLQAALEAHGADLEQGAFLVISERSMRLRRRREGN
jgi:predicted nuclease of predicted toxin-antitoxin system